MKNTSLFCQVLQFFPRPIFEKLVKVHKSDFRSKGFSSWEQFVSMLFCQFGKANSLAEITQGLASCEGRLKHLGITAPGKSTLAYANQHRPWELYQSLFFHMFSMAQEQAAKNGRKFRFKSKLYSIDSTTIDLCLASFDWALFRKAKGAVKIHMQLDHDGYLPKFAVITDGKHHDAPVVRNFTFESGSITVFDKGYTDYKLFEHITQCGAWFVTRLKDNAAYTVVKEREIPESRTAVLRDSIIEMTGHLTKEKCPSKLRVVEYNDPETGNTLQFLTNNDKLAAQTIADIYKERWQIELLFKSLKQNFRIKTFIGTSANAVKIQIWTALIAILVLKFLKLKTSFNWSLSNLSALLRMNLFTYRNLWKWLEDPFGTPPDPIVEAIQMKLNLL